MVRAVLIATLACCALISGCADDKATPRTQLVLVADTDITTLDFVQFEVSGANVPAKSERASVAGEDPPYTLAVLRDHGPLDDVTVSARGYQGSTLVVERSALVSFVPHETLTVPLHLLRSCMNVQCGEGKTCAEHGCQDAALDPDQLAPWHGTAPGLDAGDEEDAGGAELDGQTADGAAQSDAANPADAADPADAGNPPDAALTWCVTRFADLSSDVDNCGKCGKQCKLSGQPPANLEPACVAGQCGSACRPLWGDCDQDTANGCENYLSSDPMNCGGCGVQCASTEYCTFAGTCRTLPGASASAK
jgi:hypothetical protein